MERDIVFDTDFVCVCMSKLIFLYRIYTKTVGAIDNRSLKHFAKASALLQHLDLRGCTVITDDGINAVAQRCLCLRSIRLSDCMGGEQRAAARIRGRLTSATREIVNTLQCQIGASAIFCSGADSCKSLTCQGFGVSQAISWRCSQPATCTRNTHCRSRSCCWTACLRYPAPPFRAS